VLSALSVRNIVLIDHLDLGLDGGLTVLTGETGAGKSILLDALGLALGGRGDASLVRHGAESGQVVAILQLPADHPARVTLRESEITDDAELILRRVQYADGRTRAFINDQPVGAGLLQAVGAKLIEIHGQHDDRALVDQATHRTLLDAFGGHGKDVEAARDAYASLAAAESAVAEQRSLMTAAAAREDYARHVVEELSELAPEAGEELLLAERRGRLMQLEKSADEMREADEILSGPSAPAAALSGLMRRLTRKADNGASIFQPLIESLDATLNALDQTSETVEALKREMAFDPTELEQVEARLFSIRGAARKHHVSPDELAEVLAKYRAEIAALESGEATLAKLEADAAVSREAYLKAARKLSAARSRASKSLSKAVEAELPDLKLGAAKFAVDLQVDETRVAPTGFDQAAFHVQTNPGTPPGPIMKVASGGELSRFLLALKVVLADRGSAPVLIFDEIDTGVGGAVADAIGRRLKRLSEKVQVLTVTHAPQVAARANSHLFIEKNALAKGAIVRTQVRPLNAGERREELARMLAGAEISDEARAAAGKLLSDVS
jgi:DNA repair protein RecN (Recombination protein N)